MYTTVLILLTLSVTRALILRENVVYHKVSKAGLTQSRWLISMVLELIPYSNFLLKLQDDIEAADQMVIKAQGKYQAPENAGFLLSVSRLLREKASLKHAQLELMSQFNSLKLIKARQRRSLFPFLQGPLHSLFGIVTDDQVAGLRSNVAGLAENQAELVHVVEKSLSIIKMSHLGEDRNRQSINDILTSLTDMDRKIKNVTEALGKQIQEISYFIQLYSQLDLIVEELKRFVINGQFLVEHLRTQLSFMSFSRLSTSIVNPFEFKRVLEGISSRLPPNLRLPSDPKDRLWAYYHSLELTTILEENQIIIVTVLPLMQYDNHFEIYKVINLPVPIMEDSLESTDTHTVVARYDLESVGLAINLQRTKYVLLNQKHLDQCTNPRLGICDMKLPIYPVNLSNKCVVSLFLDSPEKIKKTCHKVVVPNSFVPQTIYIADGLWVVVSRRELRFSVTCQEQNRTTKSVIMKPPLDVLAISKKCEASNDYVSLMPYFMSKSTEIITDNFVSMMKDKLNLTSLSIWKPFLKNITHYEHTIMPDKLKALDSIPMDQLIEELHALRPIEPTIELPDWAYAMLTLVIAVGVGICIFVYCKYYKHKKLPCFARLRGARRSDGSTKDYALVSTKSNGHVSTMPLEGSAPVSDNREDIEMKNIITKMYPTLNLADPVN